ncbi:hypothetical protein G7Y31_00340 [Corynebacterium lizhenjunii]|uniref:Uncharacterized protein n=1 Tax=Corynebacterium lizhenjunii TaxID=2709394 RepID=A0A7T0KFP5_9CORY|nr:hypothetical protein [Corynebacterium lizhenjunii]QPK79224.1 hypothetical protein G7Y31_00340 [Corynebacterium lizhenjunii]
MSAELDAIESIQRRTEWSPSWWAVAIVSVLAGLTAVSITIDWRFVLTGIAAFTIAAFLLRKRLTNPLVRRDPNLNMANNRATWSRVVLPLVIVLPAPLFDDPHPAWLVLYGTGVTAATAWMFYADQPGK